MSIVTQKGSGTKKRGKRSTYTSLQHRMYHSVITFKFAASNGCSQCPGLLISYATIVVAERSLIVPLCSCIEISVVIGSTALELQSQYEVQSNTLHTHNITKIYSMIHADRLIFVSLRPDNIL